MAVVRDAKTRLTRNRRVWVRRFPVLLVLVFAAIFLAPVVVLAQQDLIADVVPHGNRRIPAETIRARIFTKPGDVYDQAALERDINSLWNTGYFDDLRIEREASAKGWIIHVYVKVKPTIREIK